MSKDTRFQKGTSGNPAGRPKKRRPNVSAFEIVLDKRLTAIVGGKSRELTIDEALELQTYQAALKGSRMAIRKILKMIEKRETALARKNLAPPKGAPIIAHHSSGNANEAMRVLDIAAPDPSHPNRWQLKAWAAQAALSRPGRTKYSQRDVASIKLFTSDAETLRWPPGRME